MKRTSGLRVLPWLAATGLLLAPLLAMQFTNEVDWGMADFVLMGVLLFGACGLFELAVRASASNVYRLAVACAVIGALLLIWINLAVGIIGSEDNAANLMYVCLLAAGVVGALVFRFQDHRLAQVLFAMALIQLLIAAVALTANLGSTGENWPQVIIVLNGFFACVWLASGLLFRKAAQGRS